MDFDLTAEQKALRETVRQFASKEAKALFDEAETSRQFPTQIFRRMAELGLLCLTASPEFGAAGASKTTECVVIEELSRVSSSLAAAFMIQGGVATSALAAHGSAELLERYLRRAIDGTAIAAFALTEPDTGSDAAAISTRAERQGGNYVIDGRKTYITNGGIADFLTVAAVTDKTARRGHGISLFIVDSGTPGLEARGGLRKVGHHAADTAQLFFDSCVVPAGNLIGVENKGFEYISETLTAARISHGARSLGVAESALELALDYTASRRAFGKYLADFQSMSFGLSEMATVVEAARLMVYRAAWLCDQGASVEKEASMAKLFASQVAEQVTGQSMHMHGGVGYMEESAIQRLWRDAKLFPITEGTSEIQKIIISRALAARRTHSGLRSD